MQNHRDSPDGRHLSRNRDLISFTGISAPETFPGQISPRSRANCSPVHGSALQYGTTRFRAAAQRMFPGSCRVAASLFVDRLLVTTDRNRDRPRRQVRSIPAMSCWSTARHRSDPAFETCALCGRRAAGIGWDRPALDDIHQRLVKNGAGSGSCMCAGPIHGSAVESPQRVQLVGWARPATYHLEDTPIVTCKPDSATRPCPTDQGGRSRRAGHLR
jgi:hypothetical protein